MLRLPKFKVEYPATVNEVVNLLSQHGDCAMLMSGGTDLLPNLKHRLHEPEVVIALGGVVELRGISKSGDGDLCIGASTPLVDVADSELIQSQAKVLAEAVQQIAGPQLRNMGTIGGNVMLDTRCQWINQTYFWRKSLGFCLKKDGTLCHVIEGGKKCVAAASNDSAPALMCLNAILHFITPSGEEQIPIRELWDKDGTWNKKVSRQHLLCQIRIPAKELSQNGAYLKLRERNSIDFPQLGVAVSGRLDGKVINSLEICLVALGPRPVVMKKTTETFGGLDPHSNEFESQLAKFCAKQKVRPLPNIPGDCDYRKKMVAVHLRRAVIKALQ